MALPCDAFSRLIRQEKIDRQEFLAKLL